MGKLELKAELKAFVERVMGDQEPMGEHEPSPTASSKIGVGALLKRKDRVGELLK